MRPPRAIFDFSVRLLGCLGLAVGLVGVQGCNLDNLGDPPPDADIYLPTGLLLSEQSDELAPRFLYVLNSNFDLRYNRGSLQAFDLDAVEAAVARCEPQGLDCKIKTEGLLADEVLVPSLATSYGVSSDRRRMYIAARTDNSLMYVDLDEAASGEDILDCDESERRCSDARRSGADADQSPRGLTLPPEPVGMVTVPAASAAPGLDEQSAPGDFVMVAHRGGQLSLFYDAGGGAPKLIDVLENLPLEPSGIEFDVTRHVAYLSLYARSASAGASRLLSRVAVNVVTGDDGGLDASYAYNAGSVVIDGVAAGRNTRAVRMNPAREGQLLVTGELPAMLMFVDPGDEEMPDGAAQPQPQAQPSSLISTDEIVSVADGPMRMTLGRLGGREIVAVSCFDGKQLFLIDAESSSVVSVIQNLNGPFDLAIDSKRERLYLSDFRSSSIQVIDLSHVAAEGAEPRTDAPVLAVVGIPKVVMELQ